MSKKAHFNPKSLNWLISLAVMIVVSVAVVFGSKVIYDVANSKYDESVDVDFTVVRIENIDISKTNATISSKDVTDAVNNAQEFVLDNFDVGE